MKGIIDKVVTWRYLIGPGKSTTERYLTNFQNSIRYPTEYYITAYRYFHLFLPKALRDHREYFQQEKRGFGEAAFHTMWYLLYQKYNFKNFLEIGVYRGQVMSLISYLAKIYNKSIDIYGISPFDKSGDEVSKYVDIDYIGDIFKNFEIFSLQRPNLTNAYSTDLAAMDLISSRYWDCIYIDGSHDYEIVVKDWSLCSQYTKEGGIIIIDDSALYTDYKPTPFSFKGHPGPSKAADEVDKSKFKEILKVGHNRVFQKLSI